MAWKQIKTFQVSKLEEKNSTFITVIIPARNEAMHLPALLDSLKKQTYPADLFEVLVIDDHSTDDTAEIAQSFSCCRLISLKDIIGSESINSYKKKAIETGIHKSKGTLIVTTDADCIVQSNWLQTIASYYEKNHPSLIVMPVVMKVGMRPIEIFQSLDFMTLQGITGASVYKKWLSMCNGANLAYCKKAFESVNGFHGIDELASGDDMMLMHKIAKRYPDGISFLKSPDVIVQTEPVSSVSAFFNQRIRWASKADRYDDKRIFWVLLLVYALNVMMLIIPIWSMVDNVSLDMFGCSISLVQYWLCLLFIKTIIELYFLIPVADFFQRIKYAWFFPLAQPFHIIYTVIAGWLGKFGSYEWKERKVR